MHQQVRHVVCCSDPEAEMQAVLLGMGIGQIDSIDAAAFIRSGALVPLLVRHTSERMGLYLYYGQRQHMSSRVRRFVDFAVERLRGGRGFHLSQAELRAASQPARAAAE